jgi:hypothetical protein
VQDIETIKQEDQPSALASANKALDQLRDEQPETYAELRRERQRKEPRQDCRTAPIEVT